MLSGPASPIRQHLTHLQPGLCSTDPVPGCCCQAHHGRGQELGWHAAHQRHELLLGQAVGIEDEGSCCLKVSAQQQCMFGRASKDHFIIAKSW